MTRSKRLVEVEDEDSVVHEKKTTDKKSTDGKKNEVRGESNQEKKEQKMYLIITVLSNGGHGGKA